MGNDFKKAPLWQKVFLITIFICGAIAWISKDDHAEAVPSKPKPAYAKPEPIANTTQDVPLTSACAAEALFAKEVARNRDQGITRKQAVSAVKRQSVPSPAQSEALSVVEFLYSNTAMDENSAYENFAVICQAISKNTSP